MRARKSYEEKGYLFSYDMLGEAARTQKDADLYFERYMAAIDAVGAGGGAVRHHALSTRSTSGPGLSVKLSALHPRFEPGKEERLAAELTPRLLSLARAAARAGWRITIDAEEQDRLEPTLEHFAATFVDPALDNWNGLGLAVQAYGKRADPGAALAAPPRPNAPASASLCASSRAPTGTARSSGRRSARSPITRCSRASCNTDVSYLACVRLLLSDPKAFYPQFATHNAHALAAAHVAGGPAVFEFQRLHGMGEALYEEVVRRRRSSAAPCRIYAPVGGHEDLLAYLVRRLLENGANTSFVNRLADAEAPVAEIIRDPVEAADARARAASEAPSRHSAPARDLSAGAQGCGAAWRSPSRLCAPHSSPR